jgi:hypothetical protein
LKEDQIEKSSILEINLNKPNRKKKKKRNQKSKEKKCEGLNCKSKG